jgi:hypothetical protein
MGHAEMLLAVAGLKQNEIKERTEKLSTGDWSDFAPAERLAFQFALKLSKEPSAVSDKDMKLLIDTFGRDRAMDVLWYISWCNYMTRVADAFQLQLEEENVFQSREKKPPEEEKK